MKTTLLSLLCLALTLMGQARDLDKARYNQAHRHDLQYTCPTGEEFPILAWFSINRLTDSTIEQQLTPYRYRELRDCGFNISFSHLDNPRQLGQALESSRGTGVKIMAAPVDSLTAEVVGRYKDHPQLMGYFLRDEPVVADFDSLLTFKNAVCDADPLHLTYLNLLPEVEDERLGCSGYEDYVQQFVDYVNLPLISYDHYPIRGLDSAYVRPSLWKHLEIISRVARRNNKPFWAFCLSTAHEYYPVATEAHLSMEAFSALAYGAQGIQYFTYYTPLGTEWDFHHAPIDSLGRRTAVWKRVKDNNKRIQALRDVFLGCEVLNVGHTGDSIPLECRRLTPDMLPANMPFVQATSPGVLVSHLANDGREYIVIVSRNLLDKQVVYLHHDPATVKRVDSNGQEYPITLPEEVLVLKPGGYAIYRTK